MSNKNFNGVDDISEKNVNAKKEMPPGITIDFSRELGKIKPLHGINNSPVTYGDALPELTDAGIPYVRLHDTAGPFGGTYFVDVPNIFPDFNADPEDPTSYDFAYTDAYLKGLTASGVKIFYRLGVTIENNWRIKPYRIFPPKDFLKWARICAGIIRHYNEGWADGFEYGIEYWEIWNEPENPPMWTGTPEQYYELYRTTANYLKKMFPNIKVGGYASCGFYAINRPGVTDFYKSFVTYFEDFLKYITTADSAAPLDFFSWHLYTTIPQEIVTHAEFAAAKLKEFGLDSTENIFDEWNVINGEDPNCWDTIKEMPGAAFIAAAFCLMQRSPIDKAMYYDALPTRLYCGLYYYPSCRLTKTYYSFKAFNTLYRLGIEVSAVCAGFDEIYVCAAKDTTDAGAVLIVNRNPTVQQVPLNISGMKGKEGCLLLDSSHLLTETNYLLNNGIMKLPPLSVVVLNIK
jgi:hypothetical protein